MKKTEKTALTAAIFAAAMCGTTNIASEPVEAAAYTSTTTVVGAEFVENQPAISNGIITEFKSEMSGVYGPPPTTTVTNAEGEDVVTTTRKITTVYGPPRTTTVTPVPDEQETTTDFVIAEVQQNSQPVYGPLPVLGDLDSNGKVDVYDMILLRERFAENNSQYKYTADVNNDKKISVADLVVLNKFLLGKIDREEPITTTTTFEEEDVVTTSRLYTQPLYGIMTTVTKAPNDEEDVTNTTRGEFTALYSAPVWFTTTASDEEDVTETTEAMVYPVYGPPPSWSTTVADEE